MRLHRFYVAQPLGEEVVIDDVSTIKQWAKVFRYKKGDFVILFNGDGNDYRYLIETLTPKSCTLTYVEATLVHVPTRKAYLYFSIIKKDNFELVIQKATELGITDIIPITTDRTEKKNIDFRRLTTIIQEAAEQCGRGDLPTLHDTTTIKDSVTNLASHGIPHRRVFAATLFGESIEMVMNTTDEDRIEPVAFIVGPEGGWSEDEEKFIKDQSFKRISLGETTLRAETAGIVCSFLSRVI